MLLLGSKRDTPSSVWSARKFMLASPDEVLSALTDPETIAAWAPVRFEIDGLAGSRLRPGSVERVSGSLAGVRAAFDVDVHEADDGGLKLVAHGPVTLEVSYSFLADDDGTLVDAEVRIRRSGGLTTQLLGGAVAALLNAGALACALGRIESSLGCPAEAALVAA